METKLLFQLLHILKMFLERLRQLPVFLRNFEHDFLLGVFFLLHFTHLSLYFVVVVGFFCLLMCLAVFILFCVKKTKS